MPIVGQFGSLAGLGSLILPGGAMESIATVTVGSGGASSIEFTSISGSYQHLQIRLLVRNTSAVNDNTMLMSLNSNTTNADYTSHYLRGSGSAASAGADTSQRYLGRDLLPGNNATASVFGAAVIDILDYANTSKYTTSRLFGGFDANGSGWALLSSAVWMKTDAVSGVALTCASGNFAQHSTVALYGLRAP